MAGSYFRKTRNVELSTIYWLESQIDGNWTGVNVIKSFHEAYDTAVPVVCIRLNDINTDRLEIGSTTLDNIYGIIIDIFARSDGQLLDLVDFIMEQLKTQWTYFIHSHTSGDNSSLTRTADGKCRMMAITDNRKVEILESIEGKDKYRHVISFLVKKYD